MQKSMSQHFPLSVLVTYAVFTFFAYKQKNYYINFEGASQVYSICLGILAFFAVFFGVGFLIFYGFRTTWLAPLILIAVGLVMYGPLLMLERMTSKFMPRAVWGLLSFVVIPVCAVLLVHFTPRS